MGYLIKKNNGLVSYKTIIQASDVRSMGSSPVPLNYPVSADYNGLIFIPVCAVYRLVNNNIQYNFPVQSHVRITGTAEFVWGDLLNDNSSDTFAFPALIAEQQINIGGGIDYTGGVVSMKMGIGVNLTTNNSQDATIGDGELHIVISGYFTTI